MEKADAIRKVVGCMKLVNNDAATDGEREAAQHQATKIRLEHGISTADLQQALTADERALGPSDPLLGGFLYYGDTIKPHIKRIADEIDKVLVKINKLSDLRERMKASCEFYRDVRGLVEAGGETQYFGAYYDHDAGKWVGKNIPFESVQEARNGAIKEYYQAELKNYWISADKARAHDHAVTYTAMFSDLRKDTVENIVGVHAETLNKENEKRWRLEEAKEQGCICDPPTFKEIPVVKADRYGRPTGGVTRRTWPILVHKDDCPAKGEEA